MFDKVDEIMDAIDRLQYDMPQDESDEEEESDPELDGREALQAMPWPEEQCKKEKKNHKKA